MQEGMDLLNRDKLDKMLVDASRTFAINIPMLPGELRDALTLGYLLLRNADTIEDAYRWPKDRRIQDLQQLKELIQEPTPERIAAFRERYQEEREVDDPDHLALLKATPFILDQVELLSEPYTQALRAHVTRVISRMQRWVGRHDSQNRLSLRRLKELDDYCYAVAGIVGELITTLIAIYRPGFSRPRLLFLRTLETACGAGLQLTNIIKDVFRDHLEGRYYIPLEYLPFENGGSLEGMLPIFTHAYRNLCAGRQYVCALPEEEVDIRKSVLVPMMLALATLDHLLDNLEQLFEGVDVKISRAKVGMILQQADQIAGNNDAIQSAWEEMSHSLSSLGHRVAGSTASC